MRSSIDILPNGLRVVILQLDHVHATSCALLVKAGPRYERPEENGLSHFVEHLMLRGTATHPTSLAFHNAVETIGGEINGLTQRDAMTIQMTVPPQHTAEALRLLGEVATCPTLEGINVERRVVLEEILDTCSADGTELDIDTISRRILWEGHPMAMPVAGDAELVEGFTAKACRERFAQMFVASNAVLVVAGPVAHKVVLRQARASFGMMPRGTPMVEPAAPAILQRPAIHVQPSEDAQVSALLSFPAPTEDHPDFTALLLLQRVLDDGFGARLRQAIVEQRGLAYDLDVSIDVYKDAGAFDVGVTCAPKKLVRAVERTLITIRELLFAPVLPEELQRAKTRHLAELDFALDDPGELCSWYGSSALLGCSIDYATRREELEAVTPDHILRLARSMFNGDLALLTLVGPVEDDHARRLELLLQRPFQSTFWYVSDEEEVPPLELAG